MCAVPTYVNTNHPGNDAMPTYNSLRDRRRAQYRALYNVAERLEPGIERPAVLVHPDIVDLVDDSTLDLLLRVLARLIIKWIS